MTKKPWTRQSFFSARAWERMREMAAAAMSALTQTHPAGSRGGRIETGGSFRSSRPLLMNTQPGRRRFCGLLATCDYALLRRLSRPTAPRPSRAMQAGSGTAWPSTIKVASVNVAVGDSVMIVP